MYPSIGTSGCPPLPSDGFRREAGSPPSSVLRVSKTPPCPSRQPLVSLGHAVPLRMRKRGGLPRSWGIPVRACPGLATPAARREPRLAVPAIQPSVTLTASASATVNDFGAEFHAARSLVVYASPRRSPGAGARLTTGLPATALTGLDFHQLDSVQRFHALITFLLCHAFVARQRQFGARWSEAPSTLRR